MLVDANVLISARHQGAPRHYRCRAWLESALNGEVRVGLPWQSLVAFLRITTNASLFSHPLSGSDAWTQVEQWLAAPRAWVPQPTSRYAAILGRLTVEGDVRGPLVTDAALAALAIDHGISVVSTDRDFARFPELRWQDPTA